MHLVTYGGHKHFGKQLSFDSMSSFLLKRYSFFFFLTIVAYIVANLISLMWQETFYMILQFCYLMDKIITADGSVTYRDLDLDECYHTQSGALTEALEKHVVPSGMLEFVKTAPLPASK